MEVIESIPDLRNAIEGLDRHSLGFVPTMGFLHEGHLSLFRRCREENKATVASIFVNRLQFDDSSDFENYPTNITQDLGKLEDLGVDIVFMPKHEDMYPQNFAISVSPGELDMVMCGMSRPGHFRGVLTVVLKLLNLVQPSVAYFGQKDYQQFMLISKMVGDFNLPLELRMMPIVREEDGLAMSSRNARLSAEDREEASLLYYCLQIGANAIEEGENQPLKVIEKAMEYLISNTAFDVDYVVLADPVNLKDLEEVSHNKPYLFAIAANLGDIRLIDNILHYPRG